jgi:glutathione reductase (NADPH)
MTGYDYDLFVIGAGSGGVRAARMAASYGARAAVAEEYRVGGTCVIRGCVPKKLFVYASQFAEHFDDSAGFGWNMPGRPTFDWLTLRDAKDREIDRLNSIYIRNLEAAGVEILPTRAEISGPHTIRLVAENREVTARYILVATGARPHLPDDVTGIEHTITSNEAFHLEELPDHITIVGGGYIAVEFAGIFNGLGVATTLLYRGEEILRGFDDDLRRCLHDEMVARGIDIRVMTNVTAIEERGSGFELALNNGDVLKTGRVMYATGRIPNVQGLGLSDLGVEMGWNGYVIVDEYSRSSVDHIYAVGDVTHRMNLTPVAIREGAAFAETVFNDNPQTVDYSDIPTAVFSQPEIGTVGLTEEMARERHPKLEVYKAHFRAMKLTLTDRMEKTLMKLLVCGESGKVVGCHVLGPDAGEMIQLAAVAIKAGASKADFDRTVAVHPSSAEELVLMREPESS